MAFRNIRGYFDIVIGNPPYVEAKKLRVIASVLKDNYEVYSGTADLSLYFIEQSLNLCITNGTLSFITTNKFFNTGYGKLVRSFLLRHVMRQIINFEQVEVFENVLVSSTILITSKSEPIIGNKIVYQRFYKLKAVLFRQQFAEKQGNFGSYPQDSLNDCEWSFADTVNLELKSKIEHNGICLKDVQGVSVYRGVTTGYNPAFIITNAHKDNLISQDGHNAAIIKNMLQGRNIRKWYYNESDENLIFIPWHFPLENSNINGASEYAEQEFKNKYLSLYNHILAYKQDLCDRNKDETGIRYEWYALQRCAASYYSEFEKSEKIIWGLTADKWAFAYDDKQHFLPSNGYILTSEIVPVKYLLGLLNSRLLKYYFGFIGVMTAGGAYTLKCATIESLPIILSENLHPIINIVTEILTLKTENPSGDTREQESAIDRMVYDLYGITEEERRIIDPSYCD